MEDIKNIYKLLLHSEGLKIRDISNKLGLDKYYVADVLLSEKCQSYWYENNSSLWFAIEGALPIEEPVKEEFPELVFSSKTHNFDKLLWGVNSRSLPIYINEISKYRKYTEKETGILFSLYHSGDKRAFDALVKGYSSLVIHIAIRFKNKGLALEDLIQEGNIGLIYAIKHYSYFRKESFVIYAQNHILQSIIDSIDCQTCFLAIPQRHIYFYKRIRKLVEKYEVQFSIPPSINDIWIDDVPERHFNNIFNLPDKLSKLVKFTEDLDNFPSGEEEPDENLMRESLSYFVHSLLNLIDVRDKQIIMDYYGIDRKISEFLATIGDKHNMSRERARQIVQNSIESIRKIYDGKDQANNTANTKSFEAIKKVEAPIKKKESKKTTPIQTQNEDKKAKQISGTKTLHERTMLAIIDNKKQLEGHTKAEETPFHVGDVVMHATWGRGVVKDVALDGSLIGVSFNGSTIEYVKPSVIRLRKKEVAATSSNNKSNMGAISTSLPPTRVSEVEVPRKQIIKKGKLNINEEEKSPKKISKKRKLYEKSFLYYAERIRNLKQAKIRGEVIIAKPVLLLALIEGIDNDIFIYNCFYLNEWLEYRYLSLMKKYSKSSQFAEPTSINNPFWHLTSDGFWHLHLKEKYESRATPSKKWLDEKVLFANLDDDLWILLYNEEYRNKIRNVIIDLIDSQKKK